MTATVGTTRPRRRAAPRPKRPIRPWLVAGALVVLFVAGVVGLIQALILLPLTALVVVAAAGAGHAITWSRRSYVLAGTMALGYLAVTAVLAGAAYAHVSTGTATVVLIAVQAVCMLVIAAPLAMPASPEPGLMRRRDLVFATAGLFTLTVAHLGGNTFLVLLAVAVGMPVVLAVTLRRRSPGSTSRRTHVLRAANLVVFCGLLAATVLPGTYDLLAVYGPAKATTIRIAVVVAAAIAAVLAVVPGRRIMPAMQGLVAIASVFLAVELAAAYRLPPNAVTMSAPFAGEWYVAQGGHAELVNGHRSNPSQHEALDIFAVQGGSTHRAGDTSLDAYYAYGEPLLAPADGEVVYVSDGLADRPAGSPDPDPAHAEGNQMIIDIGGGRFLYLAHLQRHSALVMAGDTVRDGQALARVGNSGNSDEPHLHIQVQDSAARDIHHAGARTYPILFRNVTLVRDGAVTHPARADLRRGDRFRATTR